eukprot:gene28840-32029_t
MAEQYHALKFEAFPDRNLSLSLFTNVKNVKDIRAKLIAGELTPDFAFLHAPAISDLFSIHVGAHKALTGETRGTMSARSLHAELIFCISGSKHIGESLKRYGISDSSTEILAARFDATADDVKKVEELVDGDLVAMEQLSSITDEALIQKYCKFSKEELALGGQAEAVVARIIFVIRGFTPFLKKEYGSNASEHQAEITCMVESKL